MIKKNNPVGFVRNINPKVIPNNKDNKKLPFDLKNL